MRRFLSLVLVASALVVIPAGSAVAASYTISDQASCEGAGGVWFEDLSGRQQCTFAFVQILAGDSVTIAGGLTYVNAGLGEVYGELIIENGATGINQDQLNVYGRLVNRGSVINNYEFRVRSGGEVDNFGSTTNNDSLVVYSGGTWSNCAGSSYTGEIFGPGTVDTNCPVASDTTPPVISTQDITVEAEGPNGTVVASFGVSATDETAPASPAVSCTPPEGFEFAIGATTVNCGATDTAGNTGEASFTVTVEDTTSPTLTVPVSYSVNTASPAGAVVDYGVTAVDSVDPSPVVACDPVNGSLPLGDTVVACTATDASGNQSAEGSFTVTVVLVVDEDTFTEVATDIEALDLPNGTESSFVKALEGADKNLDDGDTAGACDKLSSLLAKINAQDGKKLTPQEAADLRTVVLAMIDATCNGG